MEHKLKNKGKVDEANKMYLYVYRNLIIIYVIVIMIQLLMCIANVVANETDSDFDTTEWKWYNVITGSIAFVLPNTQMGMLAFLYTKNTISYKGIYSI